jgi:signal transduction histidine kinase
MASDAPPSTPPPPAAIASRLSLRAKLRVSFAGLLLILLAVSGLSVAVLTRYSRTFERIFHENYDSVIYCDAMKDALDGLNAQAQTLIWDGAPATATAADVPAVVAQGEQQFTDNSIRQRHNCFLPGEVGKSDGIIAGWREYRGDYDRFLAAGSPDARRTAYRQVLLPHMRALRELIQDVSRMNLRNMVDVDGQVRTTLAAVRSASLLLAAIGATLGLVFISVVGPSMMRPLSALTRSARQIAEGQLDQAVDVPPTRDEVGQLAAAFNLMAERLREFRRLDRERLTRTEQTTQMAVDGLPDAVVVLNPAGQIELVNRAARERFALVPHAADALPRAARPPWMTAMHERVMRTGGAVEPQGYRSALQRFDGGEERFYLPHAAPLTSADGRVVGAIVILSDVTRLKQADEAKSDLVSTVSHELKTPLTSIRMAIHMLAEQDTFGELSPRQASMLATARDNTERLHRTVENLLSIGRIESGRAPLRLQPMPAAELLEHAVSPMRVAFEQRGIHLTVDSCPADAAVMADPSCVGHVLTNLLTNAVKYTRPGGHVRVSCAAGPAHVTFAVEDDGPGISPQHLPRIFDKFFRAPVPGAPPGAGLGLAIAREIVEVHGGALSVRSEPNRATRFSFTLQAHLQAALTH